MLYEAKGFIRSGVQRLAQWLLGLKFSFGLQGAQEHGHRQVHKFPQCVFAGPVRPPPVPFARRDVPDYPSSVLAFAPHGRWLVNALDQSTLETSNHGKVEFHEVGRPR